jgi:DNA-binding response OmpR family regulator
MNSLLIPISRFADVELDHARMQASGPLGKVQLGPQSYRGLVALLSHPDLSMHLGDFAELVRGAKYEYTKDATLRCIERLSAQLRGVSRRVRVSHGNQRVRIIDIA